jgi:peptidoglycan/LPS O-acetylase OafA/YrhL
MNPEQRDLDWLQVARGAAAYLVVLKHVTLLCERKLGYDFLGMFFDVGSLGIDFFFVLSGFIIVYVHRRDIGRPGKLSPYLAKRLTRIYPMYWLVTLLVLPVFLLAPDAVEKTAASWSFIARSLALYPQEELPLLSVGWTLTHEILFYLLFALLIATPRVFSYTLCACVVVLSLWKLSMDFGGTWDGDKYRTGATALDRHELTAILFSRFNIEFFAGCLVALAVDRRQVRKPGLLALLGALAFFVPMAGLSVDANWAQAILYDKSARVIYYSLASALIVFAFANMSTGTGGRRAPRLARMIGDASYTLYLLHYPALVAIFMIFTRWLNFGFWGAQIFSLISSGVVVWIALMAYRYIEKPLLEHSRTWINRVKGPQRAVDVAT